MTDVVSKLKAAFPTSQRRQLPKVWCESCAKGSCVHHAAGVCVTCGHRVSVAHDHFWNVPVHWIERRLTAIDPGWSWAPLATTETGLPIVAGERTDRTLWVKVVVGGVEMTGVATSGNISEFGVAGLKSQAIANAVKDKGCGSFPPEPELRQIQTVHPETVTTHDKPEPPTTLPNGIHHSTIATRIVDDYGLTAQAIRKWVKDHDVVVLLGRSAHYQLIAVTQAIGAGDDYEHAAQLIAANQPPTTNEEEE